MTDTISVVVPIYNVEKYIRSCIESIIEQTYKNLEIILVDDGSPDNCGIICDEYASKDKRIKVIHKVNGGLSDARNIGISIAKGEFISFVDSDDTIEKDMYETLLNAIYTYNADIAECGYYKVYPDKIIQPKYLRETKCFNTYNALEELISFGYFQTVVWNKLYKTNTIKGIMFPVGRINEDEFWTYKVFSEAKRLVYVNKIKYYYLQRPGSIMQNEYNVKRLDALDAHNERLRFISNKYPELYNIAEKYYVLHSLLQYNNLLKSKGLDNTKKFLYEIRCWLLDNYKKLLSNPQMGKTKLWLRLFNLSPWLYCYSYDIYIKVKNMSSFKKRLFNNSN